ncbi:MAG: hypothetical protein KKB34_10830 [Bacteroidetes bacterium]|nr:hypothetical protein [Bacteroidota bacterium]
MKRKITAFLLLFTISLYAQENIWPQFEYFIGKWEGKETGKAGEGKGERTYKFLFDGTFIYIENVSKFEPQENNTSGEIHKDWGFISFDRVNNQYKLREFHSEGFINKYFLDNSQTASDTLVFISEEIENVPEGLRARINIIKIDENNFTETFELAKPGKEFTEYLKNYWKRVTKK